MPRRTPLVAILLAPVVLVLLMLLWRQTLVPLYRTVRYSDTVLQWCLNRDQPAMRIRAAKDIGLSRTDNPAMVGELVTHLETDDSSEVQKASASALGQLGAQRPVSAEAIEALSAVVLTEPEADLLSLAIGAVGMSASYNRYPDPVVVRIVAIFDDPQRAGLYPAAATALGQLGAAQPLPDSVLVAMNSVFSDADRPGERELLANAFAEIAESQPLPVATLDLFADAFEHEPNPRIRRKMIYALAHCAADYPPSVALITEATQDPDSGIVDAAENGLRIIQHQRDFADNEPLSVAVDTNQPVEVRRQALRIIRSTPIDEANFELIAGLAQDPQPEVAVAALEQFHYLARAPEDDFDQRVLIPTLTQAMSDPDPKVREAAYGALSTISIHRPGYLRAADFPALLETGAKDPRTEGSSRGAGLAAR